MFPRQCRATALGGSALAVALWAPPALAASVTVKPGDDLNALTSSLGPGDVITFTGGTYELDGTVYWTGEGTASAPIQFKAAAGSPVILQNQNGGWVAQVTDSSYISMTGITFEAAGDIEYNQPSGLYIANSDHVTLENCVVHDVWGTALRIDGDTSALTIRHNELASTGDGSGIYVGCGDASCWMQDSTLEFNLIHDVEGNGIYLSRGTQGSTVQHNVIYNTDDAGVVALSTEFGAQNVVYSNAIWQSEDEGIYIEGSVLVQNNVIFETGGDGIRVRDNYDSLLDVQISHNTVARTEGWAARLDDWFEREDLVFSNNVLANPTGYGLYWEDLEYQQGYDGTTTTDAYGQTSNYITNNVVTGLVDGFNLINRPKFVIPGGGAADFVAFDDFDYYPSTASLVRDAADANGAAYIPSEDFNGTTRDGASPDAGAYEYDGEGNPGWVIQETYKEYSPSDGRLNSGVSGGCCGSKDKGADPVEGLVLLPVGLGVLARRRMARRGR